MHVKGNCCVCGDFTDIDHRTRLCDFCAEEVDGTVEPMSNDEVLAAAIGAASHSAIRNLQPMEG